MPCNQAFHVWKAAQAGAPLRDDKGGSVSCLWLGWYSRALSLPEEEYVRPGASKDLSLRITISLWRGVKHWVVATLLWQVWPLNSGWEREELFSWLGLYCQEVVIERLMWDPWQVSLTWVLQAPAEPPSSTHMQRCKEMPDLTLQFLSWARTSFKLRVWLFLVSPRPKAASYPCVHVMHLPPQCKQTSPCIHQISSEEGAPALLTLVKNYWALWALSSGRVWPAPFMHAPKCEGKQLQESMNSQALAPLTLVQPEQPEPQSIRSKFHLDKS